MVVQVSFCLSPEYGVLGLGERVASLPASQPAATSENGKCFTSGAIFNPVCYYEVPFPCPMRYYAIFKLMCLSLSIYAFIDRKTVLFYNIHVLFI